MNCSKRCIANVDGKCCVEKCEGQVYTLCNMSHLNPEQRCNFYEAVKEEESQFKVSGFGNKEDKIK